MHFSLKRILSILFIALLIPMAAYAEDTTTNDTAEETEPIYVADYYAGTVLDLTQYEGKAVLINYFTEWCPYCMAEMPDIKQVYDAYDPNALEIILVHPWDGEDADNTASVVETYGLEGVTTIEDEDFALTGAIGVPGYPTSIIVDPEGYLYFAVASQLDYDTLTQIFDEMGVPKRESADTAATTAPESTGSDAMTTAAPQN